MNRLSKRMSKAEFKRRKATFDTYHAGTSLKEIQMISEEAQKTDEDEELEEFEN